MPLSDYDEDEDLSNSPELFVRTVKDPIHTMIPLTPRLSKFIDTKQFQRLRYIKQLGTSYFVWLGAAHNRFEHCIGVAYLARSMATHLQKSQPELNITDRDIECVEIAGLCHDLGHGPWSHVWDGLFMPQAIKGCVWRHEEGSEVMFDSLVKENHIVLNKKDEKFIKALIAGEVNRCEPDEKPFLFDIVANKRNGLDVDKFDYILRDSYMIGDPMSIALPRIIKSARVLENQICYDIKDANQLYDICATRFKLHKIVYNHKSAKAIEYMIIDGLLAAEPHIQIARRVFDPKKFLYLTDDIMPRIEESTEPELAPARAIFDRIRRRDLYRLVEYKAVDWLNIAAVQENVTRERIVAACKALPSSAMDTGAGNVTPVDVDALTEDDVIVDFSLMHYGMKEKNPLDFVKFYSKRSPNECKQASTGDYSTLMPYYHAEMLMRVYTKKPEYHRLIQLGYRECASKVCITPAIPRAPSFSMQEEEGENMVLTPPATEAPTTPRARASPSFHSLGGGGTAGTPLLPNDFMTMPPKSPTRRPRPATFRTLQGATRSTKGSGALVVPARGGDASSGSGSGAVGVGAGASFGDSSDVVAVGTVLWTSAVASAVRPGTDASMSVNAVDVEGEEAGARARAKGKAKVGAGMKRARDESDVGGPGVSESGGVDVDEGESGDEESGSRGKKRKRNKGRGKNRMRRDATAGK